MAMRKHPTRHCRKLAYGYNYPYKNEQEHIEMYRKHSHNIRRYFKNRSRDFIELCWENGDGFEELSNFLNCDIPNKQQFKDEVCPICAFILMIK